MSQFVFDEALAAQLETLYPDPRRPCAAAGWSARPSGHARRPGPGRLRPRLLRPELLEQVGRPGR